MHNYTYITLRQKPQLKEQAAAWFSSLSPQHLYYLL